MTNTAELKLKEGIYYRKSDILSLNVRSLNRRGMYYVYYEFKNRVYCFENLKGDQYYLFLVIDKLSFEEVDRV